MGDVPGTWEAGSQLQGWHGGTLVTEFWVSGLMGRRGILGGALGSVPSSHVQVGGSVGQFSAVGPAAGINHRIASRLKLHAPLTAATLTTNTKPFASYLERNLSYFG